MTVKAHYITLTFPDDYEGKVIATLIRTFGAESSHKGILYLHGFADYFFQDHLAEASHREGIRFYALDLRKCGRSLLAHQHFNYCRNLSEYYPEISQSIRQMENDGVRDITLMGHSAGGLIVTLYAAEGEKKESVSRIILNSPFFEFNTGIFQRKTVISCAILWSRIFPYASITLPAFPVYTQSLHGRARGEWNFNTIWKPLGKIRLYFAWLKAIRSGHKKIHKGLRIQQPVLCLRSAHSLRSTRWREDAARKDTVLNVSDIQKYAPRIGSQVQSLVIQDGLHDLLLSRKEVREKVIQKIFDWIKTSEKEKASFPLL